MSLADRPPHHTRNDQRGGPPALPQRAFPPAIMDSSRAVALVFGQHRLLYAPQMDAEWMGVLESDVYRRQNVEEAEAALRRMGVPPQGDFAGFYRRYSGPFSSRRTGFELLDIREGGESSIEGVTRICRERFGLPSRYLVLTEPLAGGVLIFDSGSGHIYSVDFEGGLERLIAGVLPVRWDGFAQFLSFYFG